MSEQFKLEDRYIVIKISDAKEYFSDAQLTELASLGDVYSMSRSHAGKPPLEAIVVEKDWPEYGVIYSMLERRFNEELLTPGNSFAFKLRNSADLSQVYYATVGHDDHISFTWTTKYGNTYSGFCTVNLMVKDLNSDTIYIVNDNNS